MPPNIHDVCWWEDRLPRILELQRIKANIDMNQRVGYVLIAVDSYWPIVTMVLLHFMLTLFRPARSWMYHKGIIGVQPHTVLEVPVILSDLGFPSPWVRDNSRTVKQNSHFDWRPQFSRSTQWISNMSIPNQSTYIINSMENILSTYRTYIYIYNRILHIYTHTYIYTHKYIYIHTYIYT